MVTNGHPELVRPDDSTDDDPAARHDDRDSPGYGDDALRPAGDSTVPHRDASRPASDVPVRDGGAERVAGSHQRHDLPSASESNYPAQASTDAASVRDGPRIELPQHDPAITPGVARALLRLILNSADRQPATNESPQPPRRTT